LLQTTPLVHGFAQIKQQRQLLKDSLLADSYPQLAVFISSLDQQTPGLTSIAIAELDAVLDFLYLMGRKSQGTYLRFRNEIERWCLYCWQVRGVGVFEITRYDLDAYIDFVWRPQPQWIGTSVQKRFKTDSGLFISNPKWRPFVVKVAKSVSKKKPGLVPDVTNYRPSQESLVACFTALSVFYQHGQMIELCDKNYVPVVKKNCPYLIKQVQRKTPDTLSQLQWEYVLGISRDHALEVTHFERNVFILATLKTLYLRVSEMSEHAKWQPTMADFSVDRDGFWYLTVFGKGNKIRDVTVPPAYIPYLRRYRAYRGLVGLPSPDEDSPMLNKRRGQGNLTARQIRRVVEESFDLAIKALQRDGFEDEANHLMAATTHWLRHTGATEDAGSRPLKHLADELGHASSDTTDKNYIQSNIKDRARTGQNRKV